MSEYVDRMEAMKVWPRAGRTIEKLENQNRLLLKFASELHNILMKDSSSDVDCVANEAWRSLTPEIQKTLESMENDNE